MLKCDDSNPLAAGGVPSYLSGLVNADRETIAAIATAPGRAGISIVRVSGGQSLEIADGVFHGAPPCPSQRAGGTFVHGHVRRGPTSTGTGDIDEVILLIYRAPHSYTREDVVEFQCHGGRTSAACVLQAVLDAGAKLAEPGEFTRRAFLNGRIDLLQAEAVADLIGAQSERAARAAIEQLEGGLTYSFANAYKILISVAADLEATLDFVEHELPESTVPDILDRLQHAVAELESLLSTWHEGHLLREGALVVIAGQPNAGKSTLMNRLLKKERSIVTATPGTTRDTIEETMVLDGIPLRLVDTAGLRDSDCQIEQEGISRAKKALQMADVIVYLVDASQDLSASDRDMLGQLDPTKTIVLLNKIDKGSKVAPVSVAPHTGFLCSLLTGTDDSNVTQESNPDHAGRLGRRGGPYLDQIRQLLLARLGSDQSVGTHAVISERHRQIIQYALNFLKDATGLICSRDETMILPAVNSIRDAIQELGKATGQTYTSELLNEIFNRFCIGK